MRDRDGRGPRQQNNHSNLSNNDPPMKGLLFLFRLTCAVIMSMVAGTIAAAALGTDPALSSIVAFGIGQVAAMAVPTGALAVMTNFTNILYDQGGDNMGGLRTIAYWCYHNEVQVHSEPASRDAATTYEELVTISSDHTFFSGKGWKKFYVTEDTGMVESTFQGEKDGKSFINKMKLFHPKAGAKAMGFIRFGINHGFYGIGVDAEGLKRMVGTKHYPAKMDTGSITTTETAAGRKGITFDIVHSSPYPAPIVSAALSIEADDVDSGSGTF